MIDIAIKKNYFQNQSGTLTNIKKKAMSHTGCWHKH